MLYVKWNLLRLRLYIFFVFFISSLSVCNLKDYDIVLNLQRTHFTNTPIQSLYFAAWWFPVAVFPDIYPGWCLYLACRPPISTISNRPPNGKSKKPWIPIKIPSIQARYSSDSNRPPNEKMGKPWAPIECSLYELFSGLLCDLQISCFWF